MKNVSFRRSPSLCLLGSSLATLLAALPASAATVIKQDNALDLNLAASWSTLPTPADIAQWDATVTGPNVTLLGADLTLAGLRITSPGGPVSISAGNSLGLGDSGIDLSSATQNLSLASSLKLLSPQSWKVPSGRTLEIAGPVTATGAARVDFSDFTGTLGTLTNDATGILGTWATTGTQKTLNYVSVTGGIPGPAIQTIGTAATLANVTSESSNYVFSANATPAGNLTANTLRYTGTAAGTLNNGTNTITLNGLMQSSDKALTIGASTSGSVVIGSTRELKITTAAKLTNTAAIPAPIISFLGPISNNPGGASSIIFSGNNPSDVANNADTLLLNANSTFSGGVIVASGIVRCGPQNNNCLGVPVNVTVQPNAILRPDRNTFKGNLTLNGGTIWTSNGFGDKWQPITSSGAGAITLASNSFFYTSSSGSFAITVPVTGPGGFTKMGTAGGTVILGSPSTYEGPTVIWGGILQLPRPSSLYNGDESKWTPANITLTPSAKTPIGTFLSSIPLPTLRLQTGGLEEFTVEQVATLVSQLTTVNNNGMMAGATLGIDTSNATDIVTIGTPITDSTGPGGGSINFKTFGTGTVELTGANSYSGKTIIDGTSTSGTSTLRVESINSLVTNPALGTVHTPTSSLGAPTIAANGLIEIGNDGNFNIGTLVYTGSGETTDRSISLPGQGGTNSIDHSGSGLLKFISPIIIGQPTFDKTLILKGSESGAGELAASLGDPGPGKVTSLTKQGNGTWNLSAANTFTGLLRIDGGVLKITGSGSLGGGTYSRGISNRGELVYASSADQIFSATISNPGALTKQGAGKLTLSGTNTYTGVTRVEEGILAVSGTAINDSNTLIITNGKVAATGTEIVSALFLGPDETAAPAGSTWGASGSGAANIDNLHFSGTAGIVKVASEFDLWILGRGLTGNDAASSADPDRDSMPNLLEFILGSEPNPANSDASARDLFPAAVWSNGDLVFSFPRKDLSEPGTLLTFQWSSDLSFPAPNSIPVGATSATTDGITVMVQENFPDFDTDTITITLPAAKGSNGLLFGRLRATLP